MGAGLAGEFTRRVVAPLIFTAFTRLPSGRHAMFRTVSQMRVHYPDSPLSQGAAGDIHGGDRLPWTGAEADSNFACLRSLDWQAHVYGKAHQDLETACGEMGLALHCFAWSDRATKAGFKRDALYLIRPDGYVALASAEQSVSQLRLFVDRFRLRFDGARN